MKFTKEQFIVPNFWKRLAFMLPAVVLMGVTLSFLIEVGWGTDPASFSNLNIAHACGWSLGTTQVVVYSILFIFTLIFGTQMIGFGTLANMIIIGYVADFCRWAWAKCGLHDFIVGGGFPIQLVVFILAIIAFVIVAAVYMNAQMGLSPYDSIPKIISGWVPKFPFWILRIIYDLSAVGVGMIAAAISGEMQGSLVGSIAISLLLGPVISLVAKPLEKIL